MQSPIVATYFDTINDSRATGVDDSDNLIHGL